MSNKFQIVQCINMKEDEDSSYKGTALVMACSSNPDFILMFPFSEDNASMINYLLEDKCEYDINTHVLGIYKTMVDTWKNSDRYLSGIVMDLEWDESKKEEVIAIKLILIDENGDLSAFTPVSFANAVVISAMEKVYITVNEKILDKMFGDDERNNSNKMFPEDKELFETALKIMNGKVKKEKKTKKGDDNV